MRVRDLGPLLVSLADGDHPCAGAKQAAILALLAMRANERVTVDDLVMGAWGYDASVSASSVENHVWRLRRLLDPSYSRSSSSSLVTEAGGYRLALAPDALDSLAFEALAERAGRLLADGDPAAALACCDEALRLWRGTPYEVVAHITATTAATARLQELREQLLERRIDALMAVGAVGSALVELESLTVQHPFRERLWAQRMTALAGSGRTDEALQAFQRVRTLMRDELGLEPGPELRRLQQQILRQEAAPMAGSQPSPPPQPRPAGIVHLPRRALPLLGRATELAGLLAWLPQRRLVTVTGPGGCGKTRLAIDVARAAAARFPDGVWFVDLTAVTDPRLVVDAVVSALGLALDHDGPTLPTLAAFVQERELLLVLDNCEHVLDGAAAVVDALVEEGSRAAVLTTSREPLAVDGEAVWPLEPLSLRTDAGAGDDAGAGAAAGGPAAVSDAAELFLARMGQDGVAGPDSADLRLVERICAAVDGLPLAIELAAARARSFTLDEVAEQVEDDPSRLTRIGRGPADHRVTVWSAIEWSHRLLSPSEQAVHRRLSVLPGPFTLPVATAVAQGAELDVAEIPDLLARLAHRSLLVAVGAGGRGGRATFRQLDTVRAHARQHLAEAGEAVATAGRRDGWVRHLLASRPRLGQPQEAAWFDAVDDAYPAVRATLQTAVRGDPDPRLLRLGARLFYSWYYRSRVIEARRWLESVIDAAQVAESTELTIARIALAGTALLSGRVDLAQPQLDAALPQVERILRTEIGEGEALPQVARIPHDELLELGEALVGAADAAWAKNEFAVVARVSAVLTEVAAVADDPLLHLLAEKVDCVAGLTTRDLAVTAARAEALYERALAADNLLAQWSMCGVRQISCVLGEDPQTGIVWADRLIAAHLRLGDGGGGAFLEALANFAALIGDGDTAVPLYAASQVDARRVGMVWPVQLNSDVLLERLRAAIDPQRFARLWADGERLTLWDVARDRGLIAAGGR
ncbi:BTAD domain-containing putative transcriptional regulator [Conexibacter sp. CPCC 206217]|uniref:BTAD domain-containing putative transcriptional regulator n=1 Tax=Conexibacter sp. CPCC 206217 TaxID=3064574 RepID=UPI002720AF19|nr:BTAD domain-containing putative transcriptional regulator [Conexibacter sp. CPCC 206217]MDO8209092.1 BTAD domain-containing putative transcriptional regulator [Conexibacter sp. CPCC 206217]